MGRYAQQSRRGGHVGVGQGLPPGPGNYDWQITDYGGFLGATYLKPDEVQYTFWQSRWRRPALSLLWTMTPYGVQITVPDEQSGSPFPRVVGQQQDAEIIYCNEDGDPLTQWSAFQFFTPTH